MNAPLNLPSEVYATVSGILDQAAIQRILASFSMASQQGVRRMHVMFQSSGGGIGEGICLYNFFRNLPIDLTVYNMGFIGSISVVAYLGAAKRKVNRHSHFMIHRTQTTTQGVSTQALRAFVASAVMFDKSTEAILREHIKMPDEKWANLDQNDVWFSSDDAVKVGIADEIADFSPPTGVTIYAL